MRFETKDDGSLFYITANLDEMHGDRTIGPRFQGPFDDLELVENSVFYDYVPQNIHPDALAMICFHLFFPWIGHTVEFPMAVTPSLVESLNIPTYTKLKGETKVINIDKDLSPYKPDFQGSPTSENIAISGKYSSSTSDRLKAGESAVNGWIRGGLPSREIYKDEKYQCN